MIPVPLLDTEKVMRASPETYSPAKSKVVSRIFCRWPRPNQLTSNETRDATGGGSGDGETALKKSWKSGIATFAMWKPARPLAGETSIADGGIGIVQNKPDGAIPGSKSCTCESPTAPVKRSIQMKPKVPW